MKSAGGPYVGIYAVINLVNVPIYMMAYYFLKHVQIPRLYNTRKMFLFFVSLVFSSFFFYTIWRVLGIVYLDELRNNHPAFMTFDRYLVHAVQTYSPAFLLLVWEIQEERRAEKERIQELEKQKIDTELKFLKAQLNPHFLFNSFNNLYSLVINNDPKAPDMILQLSSILDYILYKSQNKSVPMEEEIGVIEEYIALERIRYGDRLEVALNKVGDLTFPISPLLILSLVENAFKHGASGDIDTPTIKIDIIDTGRQLHCNIWNTKSTHTEVIKDPHKEGIGLSNIKRQLELQYLNQYELEIKDHNNSYNVQLKLNLKDD